MINPERSDNRTPPEPLVPETPPGPIREPVFLSRIYALLDGHLHDSSVCVNWLANELAISRKTLYRRVYRLRQLTPNDLIRQYRLHKAADLLSTGCSVAQTASFTGFKTSSHFTAVFKEFYRQTPTKFMASRINRS
jgi:AraC-like DNA-binding protein